MNGRLRLTDRDIEILGALAEKVRLFSLRQLTQHWWAGETSNARRRLRKLTSAGYLARLTVLARPLPVLEAPLFQWQPGTAPPDYQALAYRCQRRWRRRPARHCRAFLATGRASTFFGAPQRERLDKPTQATHDLGVAQVWLRLREIAPHLADAWAGEDAIAHTRLGQKLPDAVVVHGERRRTLVVEFAGAYGPQRLRAFHHDCQSRNLPYCLW